MSFQIWPVTFGISSIGIQTILKLTAATNFDPEWKTLLSDKISFKVDILEEEARAIPELNHYFISWNVYIVPTVSSSNMEKKLLRSTTQTDLVVQYNMKQLNVNGEMTGNGWQATHYRKPNFLIINNKDK